jgi:hypothetical protein
LRGLHNPRRRDKAASRASLVRSGGAGFRVRACAIIKGNQPAAPPAAPPSTPCAG